MTMAETTSPVPTTVDRPLNTTQTRNIMKLVKNDFEALTIDLNRARTARMEEAEKEVQAQWEADHPNSSARALTEAANKAGRRYNTTMKRLRKEAQAAGVRFDYHGRNDSASTSIEATDNGLEAALSAAREVVHQQFVLASGEIRKRRSAAERKVLLASITPSSEVLVAELPTGAEMLALGTGEQS